MLMDLFRELCGDDGRDGGACLRQIRLAPKWAGRPYGELVSHLILARRLVPLGLFRCAAGRAVAPTTGAFWALLTASKPG